MKFALTFLLTLTTLCALLYGGFLALENYTTQIRSNAVDGCLHASLYRTSFRSTEGADITTETAIESDVSKCLEKKGITQ